MKSQVLIAAFAALAVAVPAADSISARKPKAAAPYFDCPSAFNTCLHNDGYNGDNNGYASHDCGYSITECGKCAKQEADCYAAAFSTKPTGADCAAQAAFCYFRAWNPVTTYGPYYDCGSAVATCNKQPFVNHAVCGSVMSACAACQKDEEKCRTAPGANESYCSSSAAGCFAHAVGLK